MNRAAADLLKVGDDSDWTCSQLSATDRIVAWEVVRIKEDGVNPIRA